MGFDSGLHWFPILIASIHLFTFIPAVILTCVPLKILLKPNIFLKVWYGYIVTLCCGLLIYKTYNNVNLIIESFSKEPSSGKVCYIIEDYENIKISEVLPSVDIYFKDRKPSRTISAYNGFKNGTKCVIYSYEGYNPLTIYAYTATVSNMDNGRAWPSDKISKLVSADITLNAYTCFYIKKKISPKDNQPEWFVDNKECDSGIDPNAFPNTIKRLFYNFKFS